MKRRLIWVLTTLSAVILYLFENNAGTLTILASVLVIPLIGLIPLCNRRIQVEVVKKAENGMSLEIKAANAGLLPAPALTLTLTGHNLHTGETVRRKLELSLLPKQRKRIPVCLDCPHCGKVRLEITDAVTCDLFGLFSRRLTCGAHMEWTVPPLLFQPSIFLEESGVAAPDGQLYSTLRPGFDPGETFAIREYVPGDKIRRIHWKLSEKTGKTMVREFGLPVMEEAALLLETAGAWDAAETGAITGVFASLSAAMAAQQICHHVFWRDTETDALLQFQVASAEDFSHMLDALLELPPKKGGSVAVRFAETYPHCPYAHVILVGGQIPNGVRELYNGNHVSLLVPDRIAVPEGLQPDGTYVLTFSTEHYALDLCRMEV